MAEKFYLDPEGTRRTTRAVRDTSSALGSALHGLNTVLDQHDGCWGTDDIGANFAVNYVNDAKLVRGHGKTAVGNLGSWADGVDKVAGEFQELDGVSADRVRSIDHDFVEQLKAPS
ncbi:hypothetical protein HX744_26105 [Pseudonocardia sp. ICBG1122]|nr:hypothetical protein [Pseudonocardia pini]